MHRILDKSADDENGIATFKVIRCDPEVLQMTHAVWLKLSCWLWATFLLLRKCNDSALTEIEVTYDASLSLPRQIIDLD